MDAIKTPARWGYVGVIGLFFVLVLVQLWNAGTMLETGEADAHADLGLVLRFFGIAVFVLALAARLPATDVIMSVVFAVLVFLQPGFAEGFEHGDESFFNKIHIINPFVFSGIGGVMLWRGWNYLKSAMPSRAGSSA